VFFCNNFVIPRCSLISFGTHRKHTSVNFLSPGAAIWACCVADMYFRFNCIFTIKSFTHLLLINLGHVPQAHDSSYYVDIFAHQPKHLIILIIIFDYSNVMRLCCEQRRRLMYPISRCSVLSGPSMPALPPTDRFLLVLSVVHSIESFCLLRQFYNSTFVIFSQDVPTIFRYSGVRMYIVVLVLYQAPSDSLTEVLMPLPPSERCQRHSVLGLYMRTSVVVY